MGVLVHKSTVRASKSMSFDRFSKNPTLFATVAENLMKSLKHGGLYESCKVSPLKKSGYFCTADSVIQATLRFPYTQLSVIHNAAAFF